MSRFGRWGWIAPLAALICCGFMAVLMASNVADSVQAGAEAALEGVGLGDAVEYDGIDGFDGIGRDGLNVVLVGPAAAEQAAVDAVRARSEVDQVTYRISDSDDSGAADPDAEAESDVRPPAGLDAARVSATVTGEAILLEGVVPDGGTRSALITSAVIEYGAANVTHDLVVDPETVTLAGGTLVLAGEAASDDEQAGWATRVTAIATAGGLTIADQTIVQTVEKSLNELFTLEPIEFDVNRATIRSRSEPTLNAAAELINANPDVGRLRVIGHTDGDGSAETNQQLSEARAQAVVDYLVTNGGVDADRLEAEGRGESELLVEPEVTPEDKQRNRRIAWELVS